MEQPNYFLIDLPEQANLSAGIVTDACRALKRNRKTYLAHRTTESIINTLAGLARDWLDPDYIFRKEAIEKGTPHTGFSQQILARGLDSFFKSITRENLNALVNQDLGQIQRLEEMVATPEESRLEHAAMARGPEFLVHITGGVLPNPTFMSIILGLLARSAQFVKCASGTSFLPRLFAHSLYITDPKLASCLEMAEWKGGNRTFESALFHEADCVTATGADETLQQIRVRLPQSVRYVTYGNKLSFAYISRESLTKINMPRILDAVAQDITAWDQLGCLSPHAIYIETGGALSAMDFAEMLGKEMAAHEETHPRGEIETEAAAAITTRRMFYQVRASAAETTTKIWHSSESTSWTVIYEEDPQFQRSCLNRFIYVKGVADTHQLLESVAPIQGLVSTVGISAPINRAQEIATELARWGASRICRIGQMQNPPLTWRHDGRPSLGDLVTWTDWEM
jgi:hypothetical protein